LASRNTVELQRFADRFQKQQRLAGVAVYAADGRTLANSIDPAIGLATQPSVARKAQSSQRSVGELLRLDGWAVYVFAQPIRSDGEIGGTLVLFEDAGALDAQESAMWRTALLGALTQTILIAGVTLLILRWSMRRPLVRLAQWLHDVRAGTTPDTPDLPEEAAFRPLRHEMNRLATSLTAARAAAEEEARLRDSAESLWTAERLRISVQGKLEGSRLFAISNREPYEHFRRGDKLEWSVPGASRCRTLSRASQRLLTVRPR
jgi:hypothetical protein